MDGLVLLVRRNSVIPSVRAVMLSILDIVARSCCGGSQGQVLIKMTVLVLTSSNGDKRASRNFYHLEVDAKVKDVVVDIGELATKL